MSSIIFCRNGVVIAKPPVNGMGFHRKYSPDRDRI
jgi:hypothetical protein